MHDKSLGIVFGRPWLSRDSDVLKGFELGRLGLACLSSEQIILHTHSFYEISYLIKTIGKELFFKEVKAGKLRFVCQIENVAICILNNSKEKSTVTIIYPVELAKIRSERDIQLFGNLFLDEKLEGEEIKLLFDSVEFTSGSLNEKIMESLILDILDIKVRPVITKFFQEWFDTNEKTLDFLEVEGKASLRFKSVPIETIGFSDDNLQTLFFILYTAYSQIAICNTFHVPQVFSDKVIFDLQFAIMKSKNAEPMVKPWEIVDIATKSIELPNISWLVSREILHINTLLSFKNSNDGAAFRVFLKTFKNEDEDTIQKVQQALIKSLHGKTDWESAWESGVSKVMRLGVTTGIGLIPGIGTILGLGATAVDTIIDKAIPRNYKPTVVLDNMISKNTDAEKIIKEKSVKSKFPSLDELEKNGFKASFFVVNLDNTKAWIFLDKPGKEEHWEISLDLNSDCGGEIYLQEFLTKIKSYSKDIQDFISILKEGGEINKLTTSFANNPETGESSLVLSYEINSNSGIKKFSSGEKDFWDFIQGRKYFDHPISYNNKISKIII